LTGSNAPPSLSSLCEMAQWRKDYIAWLQKARAADLEFQHSNLYKPPSQRQHHRRPMNTPQEMSNV
jgi:hypothetical protein